jgi:3-phosphoshikimate 1-carboxyvinyltransferase
VNKAATVGGVFDASQCPDLVPIVAILGALSHGTTKIINAKRLRYKESDRLAAIAEVITILGGDVVEYSDGLIVQGSETLKGGQIDSHNDHRIAMAAAVASIRCEEDVIITNADSVRKSYPNFFEDFTSLGGKVYEFSMGE